MKFSVFTPTHDTAFLVQAYNSLLAQTLPDWEWVIVLNGGAQRPGEITDPRVHVLTAPQWLAEQGVGALKRFACSHCEGDYLVELDHDDTLTTGALATIAAAIAIADPGFLYSDAIRLRADGTSHIYGKEYGWETYAHLGHQVNSSFPITPSSLREIFYAPDHVRVWQRAVYEAVGGHDSRLPVCDDFDLVIRTYLAGVKFHYIPEVLYMYRLRQDGQNTWLQKNQEIQQKQAAIGAQYQSRLIEEWCRRETLPKYDIGCGKTPALGYIGVDLPGSGAGVECNLAAGLPFEDNSVGVIRAYDFLEHVPHCRDSRCAHFDCVVHLMNEIHRVLVPGGWLLSATPSTDGRGAFQDPTHCSFWNENSFWYYTRQQQRAFVPGIKARFQKARVWTECPTPWHKQHNISYVYAELVALKGQRQPGICEV